MTGPSKKRCWLGGTLAVTALLAAATGAAAGGAAITREVDVEIAFTGDPSDLKVPAGVASVDASACGAEGGRFGSPTFLTTAPGRGARVDSSIAVTPGETLTVRVGGVGTSSGGFNGGGSSPLDPFLFDETGGGGGATDIRRGGDALANRVLVAGGGGGGGAGISGILPLPNTGGDGGLVGADASDATGGGGGASATAGGVGGTGFLGSGGIGRLGLGGAGAEGAGGGGGGLFGGGGGGAPGGYGAGGGGGSSLGDTVTDGYCEDDGALSVSYVQPLSALPSGAGVAEPTTSATVNVPVSLAFLVDEPVVIQWSTFDAAAGVGLAAAGSDFVAASGTIEIPPGATESSIPIDILGDDVAEPALLWGEWGFVRISIASGNAIVDTTGFFGLGVFVILDND